MSAFKLPIVAVPSEIWVVIDDSNEPCFAALDNEACVNYIKQSIEYYYLEEARTWKIVQYKEVEACSKD